MEVGRDRRLILWLALALLAGQAGCALKPLHRLHRLPSEEVRGQLGTVGVVSPRIAPEASVEGGKGTGAAKGAWLGAASMIGGGLESGPAHGLLLGIALAPVAALVGGIYGAVAAEPASRVEEAERALHKVLAELKVQETIRDLVLEVARVETGYQFVSLAQRPATGEERVDYRSLVSEGIDTILEVGVSALGLEGPFGVNVLVVEACARLIRTADGAQLYALPPEGAHPLLFISRARKFVEWGAEDARPFREELDRGLRTLAEKMVEDLFLVHRLPGWRWEAPGFVPGRSSRCPRTAQSVAP